MLAQRERLGFYSKYGGEDEKLAKLAKTDKGEQSRAHLLIWVQGLPGRLDRGCRWSVAWLAVAGQETFGCFVWDKMLQKL